MYSSQKNVAIYYRTFYCLVINKSFKFNVMMTERDFFQQHRTPGGEKVYI